MNTRKPLWALIAALALIVTACGGGATPTATPPPPTQPPAQPTTAPAQPTAAPTEPPAQPTEPPAQPTTAPTATAEPAPMLNVPSGWYIYSNGNDTRDLALHDGVLYAAGTGGVVAWNLADGTYRKYTTLDGLPHISVNDITACNVPEPRLVAGTLRGLALLDPTTGRWQADPFTPEDSRLAGADISKVYCDQANNRLLIGYSGLGIYDLGTGAFKRFTTDNGLSWNGVRDIAVAGQDIWVATGYNGIAQIRGDNVTIHNQASGMPNERALAVVTTANAVWVGASSGLLRFSSNAWKQYDRSNTTDVPGEVAELALESDGTLWLGSAPIGQATVCHFDPVVEQCAAVWRDFGGYVTGLVVDGAGGAYYSTERAVHVLDGEAFAVWRVETDQLVSNFVDDVATDAAGQLWVGTSGGLHRFDPGRPDSAWELFRSGDTPGLNANWGRKIAAGADGSVWVAMVNGNASAFDGAAWRNFDGLRSFEAAAVDSQGRGWFGDDSLGLVMVDGGSVISMTMADGLPSNNILSLLAEGDALWIGTNDGLARYAGGQIEIVFTKDDPRLPGDAIAALALDGNGGLLMSTYGSIVRYAGGEVEVLIRGEFNGPVLDAFTSVTGLAVAPTGRLWAATTNGLLYTDNNGQSWTKLTPADGLPASDITALHVDAYGTLWIGGGSSNYGGGLARYVPPESTTAN